MKKKKRLSLVVSAVNRVDVKQYYHDYIDIYKVSYKQNGNRITVTFNVENNGNKKVTLLVLKCSYLDKYDNYIEKCSYATTVRDKFVIGKDRFKLFDYLPNCDNKKELKKIEVYHMIMEMKDGSIEEFDLNTPLELLVEKEKI